MTSRKWGIFVRTMVVVPCAPPHNYQAAHNLHTCKPSSPLSSWAAPTGGGMNAHVVHALHAQAVHCEWLALLCIDVQHIRLRHDAAGRKARC